MRQVSDLDLEGSIIDHVTTKQTLRRAAQQRREAISERAARSIAIMNRVMALDAYQQATAIHCYLSIGSEVDTYPLAAAILAAGKALIVPVILPTGQLVHSWLDQLDPAALVAGPLGIPTPQLIHPAQPGNWQLTLVPLLAFDRRGYRLGYGKGYYDRLLAEPRGLAVGLAFAAQEVAAVPREAHDQSLDLIVTEDEVIGGW